MNHDVYDTRGTYEEGDTEAVVPGARNGVAATRLRGAAWQKSRHSNSQGSCVEFARLPGGEVAMRNSRFPEGPALVYTRAEIEAMLLGVKDGEFDHLIAG
ncbi:DUF397 domain-containing protein [Streptomyces sp. WMMC905]|uniref:DUF397 domain-containing protein n=1 Tax=Streptomyces sp. WMMC905 TaxID=3404123 RepID=UPI003B94B4D1